MAIRQKSNIRPKDARVLRAVINSFANTITKEREKQGWTKKQLSAKSGFAVSTISNLESGKGDLGSMFVALLTLGYSHRDFGRIITRAGTTAA